MIVITRDEMQELPNEESFIRLLQDRGINMSYQVVEEHKDFKDMELLPNDKWKWYEDPETGGRIYEPLNWDM